MKKTDKMVDADQPRFESMEEVIRYVDPNGRWQYWTMVKCFVVVTGISTVVYGQGMFFTGKLEHECVLYADGADAVSALDFINFSNSTRTAFEIRTAASVACARPSDEGGAKCIKWRYSLLHYDATMVNEYDLVCDQSFWIPLFQSAGVWGQFIGLPLWGFVSDRFGRLPTIRFGYALFLATSGAMTVVRPFYLLFALRIFLGFILCAVWNACFVICMELSTLERRNSVGVYVGTGWPLGATITACLAYFIRDYRHAGTAAGLVALLCAPVVFFMEESPRWLVMHKKFNLAKKSLKLHVSDGVVVPNGTEFLHRIYRKRMEQEGSVSTQSRLRQITRLLTERRLRIRTLVLSVAWISVAFVFNGVMFYTRELPFFSPMLTFGLLSALRIVAQPLYVLVSNLLGVRNGMMYALAVAAVTMSAAVLVRWVGDGSSASWILYALLILMGFGAADHCLTVIYIVTGELYPTVLRQSSLGFFSMAARVGSSLAPYVTGLAVYWLPLPALLFGVLCMVSLLGSLALPRADDTMLPDTVTQAAELIDDVDDDSEVVIGLTESVLVERKSDLSIRNGSAA